MGYTSPLGKITKGYLVMKFILSTTLLVLLNFSAHPLVAETINIGRSDVRMLVPDDYTGDKEVPLVVLLHGYRASGMMQEFYMRFGSLVNEYQFLYLIPDGTVENSQEKNRFWNATKACCNSYGSTVDDSNYLHDLIEAVKSQYAVDNNRVFLIGHSNGGFMSHRMAYDHPDTVAAIASLAGASMLEMSNPTPKKPVNILQIHGTDDDTVKYEGGKFSAGIPYPSAIESMEKWIVHNGADLDKRQLKKNIDLEASIDGDETTVTQFDKHGNIELWSIENGGHVPKLSISFTRQVIEWLFDHPKI
ncbi:MAG: polyhydroxybutyrate depolymerase [Gammaproteobacteria bacterium]|jgi:polyhydroxybutyrate depolymerase